MFSALYDSSSTVPNKEYNVIQSVMPLILKKGFVGLGMQEILETSKIPKGSFYHYFKSKENFACVVLHQYISSYREYLDYLVHAEGLARDRLLGFFELWIDAPGFETGLVEQCLVVKVAAEVSDLSEELRIVLDRGVASFIDYIAKIIAQGQIDESIKSKKNPDVLASMIYHMWIGAALISKLQQSQAPLDQALKTTRILLSR